MNEFELEHVLIDMFNRMKNSINARPLNLGGIAGSGGGIGGPPGGFTGYLPQTRVSYDLSEIESLDLPVSGASLLDNLNRIRYRINTLETTIESGIYGSIINLETIAHSGMDITIFNRNPTVSGGLITNLGTQTSGILSLGIKVYDDGILESSEIQEFNFINSDVTVSGKVATISGGGGSMDFLGLTDTPNTYSGQANKVVSVNAGATGLEFTTLSGIVDSTAIHSNISGEIASITEKVTPVDNDITIIEDSAATNAKKRLSWTNIKAALKTFFDTKYMHRYTSAEGAGEFNELTDLGTVSDNTIFPVEEGVSFYKRKLDHATIRAAIITYYNTNYVSSTPAPYKIPITTASGNLNSWITGGADVTAIHDNEAGEIIAITEKTTPVDADVTLIEDSAATNAKKRLSWSNIKATLKSYFDTLYAIAAKGVTNGDSHDHLGGDGGTIAHTSLSAIGTNSHATIDTFIASKGAASGVASLNASTKVVEDPANATATPTASKIPIADSNGFLNAWLTHPPEVFRGATFTEEFRALSDLPSGWAWASGSFITPPTINYYSTGIHCTGYTTISKSFLYKTPNAAQRSYYVMCPVYRLGVGSYVGWRIDDGTDNNYVEHVHAPQSDGSWGELKRTRAAGGTPVETLVKSYVTPLPWITIYAFCNGTLWSDWYVDYYVQGGGVPFMSLTGGGTHWTWTPSRVGFIINIATASAPYLYALLDAWTG